MRGTARTLAPQNRRCAFHVLGSNAYQAAGVLDQADKRKKAKRKRNVF